MQIHMVIDFVFEYNSKFDEALVTVWTTFDYRVINIQRNLMTLYVNF